jgi:hypothetical protein
MNTQNRFQCYVMGTLVVLVSMTAGLLANASASVLAFI